MLYKFTNPYNNCFPKLFYTYYGELQLSAHSPIRFFKQLFTSRTGVTDSINCDIKSVEIYINESKEAKVNGIKIKRGSDYIVVYKFFSHGSHFWRRDIIEYHNRSGIVILCSYMIRHQWINEEVEDYDSTYGHSVNDEPEDYDSTYGHSVNDEPEDYDSTYGHSVNDEPEDYDSTYSHSVNDESVDYDSTYGHSLNDMLTIK
jgi:hypothetical protein